MTSRVVVTGMGLVTALGAGAGLTWGRIVRGERGLGPVTLFDTTASRSHIGGQVKEVLAPRAAGDPSWSRTTALALTAAREAMQQAGLVLASQPDGVARAGLVVGGTVGGMFETEELLARFHVEPAARGALSLMLSHPLTATSDHLERELGPFARTRTLSSACSGGANALAIGATWIALGLADVVLAGASDALCRLTWSGFSALGAMDPEPCRPFDVARRGLSLGEGAGFVVLESETHARARGAAPIVELAGWAMGSEAHHVTNPEATGAVPARLMREALARARLGPRDVDYVNAHGTATPLNDAMETRALHTAFGDALAGVRVSSTKGQVGHTLGAAGAIEAIVAALAITHGVVPPTAGLATPDPACELRHVLGHGEAADVKVALSSSFGFGGMDAVLVLAALDRAPPPPARAERRAVVTGTALLGATLPGATMPAEAPLDPPRARRLDRGARIATSLARTALETASRTPSERAGTVFGRAFGSVDGSSAFMCRLFEKGARLVSPAEFPNLVPSAPLGHASIYLERRGPALAVADLSASGDAAIAQALELVLSGDADQVVAGAVEDASEIVTRVLVALFSPERAEATPRTEGGAMMVLEDEAVARASGVKILARVEALVVARAGALALGPPRVPLARACVVVPHDDASVVAVLAGTPWETAARIDVGTTAGEHEALGAMAAVRAVELVATGAFDEALVLCDEPGRGYALLVGRP